jgi:AraC-like DNA-binding protein
MGSKRQASAPPGADHEQAHSYSARLVQPFLRVLRPAGVVPPEWLAALRDLDVDQRIPVAVVHQLLDGLMRAGAERVLGLKAARERSPGEGGALDHAISSAATVRDAIEAACRYMRLVNDGLELRLDLVGDDAVVRFGHPFSLPQVAAEFELGAVFHALRSVWATGAGTGVRVLVPYPAPQDTAEYARTFAGARVEFGFPFAGFAFEARHLDARLASSEARLHEVILRHAEHMLEELPRAGNLTERVRSAIAAELAGGNPSIANVARRFRMSPRTLERRLEREGTTFSVLLDDLRRRMAMRHVGDQDLDLAEVAFLLGFSQTSAFHRAFRRWTGETPLAYRRARRPRRPGEP